MLAELNAFVFKDVDYLSVDAGIINRPWQIKIFAKAD